jgi:hypothetical protein
MVEEFKEIRIPESLFRRLKDQVSRSEFENVEDLSAHLLRRGLVEETSTDSILTEEEEEKIKQRLRDLGYLD